jgi:hypothetical protein
MACESRGHGIVCIVPLQFCDGASFGCGFRSPWESRRREFAEFETVLVAVLKDALSNILCGILPF